MTAQHISFKRFPEEARLVGVLLTKYSDLEIYMMHCAQRVRGGDLDTVLKVMYRTRGETARIQIADAFSRVYYSELSLDNEFAIAIGAVKYCLRIRNQYAHGLWWDDNTGKLAFADLEEIASKNEMIGDLSGLTPMHIDVPLLQQQYDYFVFAENLLNWVNVQGQVVLGEMQGNPYPKPATPAQPPLYIERGQNKPPHSSRPTPP